MEALDTYDDARLPVPTPASRVISGDPNKRQRFYVELTPGETTIVSWKELVREANNKEVFVDSLGKALVKEDSNEVVDVDLSEKTVDQEPNNEVVSLDSPNQDPVIPFALVKREKYGSNSATTDQQHA
ncbi:uncharacterized protein LOC141717123 isoform X2 [Apium graveolens]|uniref:uncharacterized protein LOC141717123 isoform X2 n=1 Tax=Apium graveolens TaxID=4045 RepID=UPI003D7B5018